MGETFLKESNISAITCKTHFNEFFYFFNCKLFIIFELEEMRLIIINMAFFIS